MDQSVGILLNESSIFLRAASSQGVRSDVTALTRKRYEWRGYEAPGTIPKPNTIVLSAEDPATGNPIGTIASRIDGMEGLGCDDAFADIVDELRAKGLRLAEFVGLATEPGSSVAALGALFHSAFLFATQVASANYVLMEVNPRHRAIYTRSLRFDVLSEVRTCERAQAPALLLGQHRDVLDARAQELVALRKNSHADSKNILSYFFTPEEAAGVQQRLFGGHAFMGAPRTPKVQWKTPHPGIGAKPAQS